MPDNINYTKINWKNGKDGGTPLNATNLDNMDSAIASLESELLEIQDGIDELADKSIKKHTYEGEIKFDENTKNNLGFTSIDEIKNTDIIVWKNPYAVHLEDSYFITGKEEIIFRKQCQTNNDEHIIFTAFITGFYTHGPGIKKPFMLHLTFGTGGYNTNCVAQYLKMDKGTASDTYYDKSKSKLESTNVQDAIDELASKKGDSVDTSKLEEEITDLKNALYGSIFAVENQTYENVGTAVIDRANGYPIVDNQKAQVTSIKGKSLVVNQLQKISTNATYTDSETGLTITNNGDGSIRISGTILATKSGSIYITQPADMTTLTGQTYLTILGNSSPYLTFRIAGQNNSNMTEGVDNKIWVGTADRINASNIYMGVIGGVGQTIDITIKPKTINLNKAFASQTLPTTIEEFRKATIGFDFDTYNEGTIESTEISKFMVNPFNAFDGTMYRVGINNNTGNQFNSNVNITSDYIPVISGETYTWSEGTQEGWNNRYAYCYDKDQKYIRSIRFGFNTVSYYSAKLPDNCCFVRLSYYDNTETQLLVDQIKNICFHLTGSGSMNGVYKPYKAPVDTHVQTIDLNGIGTAQDERTENRTTRRTAKYTIKGSETFSIYEAIESGLFRYSLGMPLMKKQSGGDGLCDKLPTDTGLYNKVTIPSVRFGQHNTAIYFYLEQQFATSAEVAQYLKGVTIIYPLNTPTIEENGLGEILLDVERGGTISTDSNGDVTLTHVVYKPIE